MLCHCFDGCGPEHNEVIKSLKGAVELKNTIITFNYCEDKH